MSQYGAYVLHAGKARLHTHTRMHTQICNTYCFSTATMIRQHASMLGLYIHCLPCYYYKWQFSSKLFLRKVTLPLINRCPPQLKVSAQLKIIFIASSSTLPYTGICYFLDLALHPSNLQSLTRHHATPLFSFLPQHPIRLSPSCFFLSAEWYVSQEISANLAKILCLSIYDTWYSKLHQTPLHVVSTNIPRLFAFEYLHPVSRFLITSITVYKFLTIFKSRRDRICGHTQNSMTKPPISNHMYLFPLFINSAYSPP